MPKNIRTRTTMGDDYFSPQITGHSNIIYSDFLNNVVSATVAYTSNNILGNVGKDTSINIPELDVTTQEILLDLGVSTNEDLFPTNNTPYNDTNTFNTFNTFNNTLTNTITDVTVITETIIVEKVVEIQENCDVVEAQLVSDHNNQIQMLTEDYETQILILKSEYDDSQYGLTKEEVREIYEYFVKAYVNKGPYYLPNMNMFHKYYTLIDVKLKEQYADDFRLMLYRDMLTALVQNRTVFFENIKLNSEVNALRKYRDEAKHKILELTKELEEFCKKTGGSYFEGKIGIKLKKPKRLIYAQALLNINMAWYIYLHDTAKIEANQYMSTIAYVNQLGSDAYQTLITLLDERYETLEDFLDEIEDKVLIETSDSSSCSDTTSSSSCTDTTSSSSCNDTTSCSDEWTTASEEEYCEDESFYYPEDKFNINSLYYVLNPATGEKMLQLGGGLNMCTNGKFVKMNDCHTRKYKPGKREVTKLSYIINPITGEKMLKLTGNICVDQSNKFSTRKTCKKKKRKKKKKKVDICYSLGDYDATYVVNPETGKKMLKLCGELYVKQMNKFTIRKRTRKKKNKKKKRKTKKKSDDSVIYENDYHDNIRDKLLYITLPNSDNKCLVVDGEVYVKQIKKFNDKYIRNTEYCEQESTSKTFYEKPNIHENTPTYLFDYKTGNKYLVLNGCIDVKQLPQFNKSFIYNYVKNHIENYI